MVKINLRLFKVSDDENLESQAAKIKFIIESVNDSPIFSLNKTKLILDTNFSETDRSISICIFFLALKARNNIALGNDL